MQSQLLHGRVALVTGASKGLGRCLARELVASGARVALLARSSDDLERLGTELGNDGIALPCDVRCSSHIASAIERAATHFGRLDILVNNAASCSVSSIENAGDEMIAAEIETNLMAPIWAIRAAVPHLRASGQGHIVNVSSEIVRHPSKFLSIYAASKAGLEALSAAVEAELRHDNVRVTVFRVGRMSGSSLQKNWSAEVKQAFAQAATQGGLDSAAGDPMNPETAARALVNVLKLPRDARVDLIEVRGT